MSNLLNDASLIVTPNAYKEGKLYSVIPSDGSGDLSVTRATTATRVNSAGLVELVPYNLVTYTEGVLVNYSSAIGNLTNATTSINGFANSIQVGNNSQLSALYKVANNWVSGTQYTFSCYVQMDDNSTPIVGLNNSSGDFGLVFAGLLISSGTISVVQISGTNIYRISTTSTQSGGVGTFGIIKYTGQSAKPFRVTGYQVVEGSNALPYQKTETRLNIPRLDYSLGGCPNILLEPQRTNLALQSSSFDSTSWTKNFGGVGLSPIVTANAGISPEGLNTADRIQFNLNGGTAVGDVSDIRQLISTTATSHTFSFYAKSFDGNSAYNMLVRDANGFVNAITVTGTWTRFTITATYTAGSSTIGLGLRGAQTPTNPNTADILIWGAQFESGSYATSYIPTTSATVTRNADVISKTGISSLIGQTEGTLYAEVLQMGASTIVPFQISDTTNNNRAQIEMSNNGAAICVVTSGGVNTAIITGSNLPYNQYHKIAVTYKANEFKLYVNGSLVGTDTSGAVPISPSAVYIGSESGSSFAGFKMKSAIHWKEVLTADQLEALTGTSFNTYAAMASYYNYTLQ